MINAQNANAAKSIAPATVKQDTEAEKKSDATEEKKKPSNLATNNNGNKNLSEA